MKLYTIPRNWFDIIRRLSTCLKWWRQPGSNRAVFCVQDRRITINTLSPLQPLVVVKSTCNKDGDFPFQYVRIVFRSLLTNCSLYEMVEATGVEPATICLQSRCSTN